MTGKGFISSTAALLTGIGTLLAALVALAILLVGEGVLFKGDGSGGQAGSGPGVVGGGAVEFEGTYGYDGTEGIELDGEKGIIRNSRDPDITFFTVSGRLGAYSGSTIVAWTAQKQPTGEECAKLLETHGASGTYEIEIGARFCVRSSGGRTAFLAVISDGKEYRIQVWKNMS